MNTSGVMISSSLIVRTSGRSAAALAADLVQVRSPRSGRRRRRGPRSGGARASRSTSSCGQRCQKLQGRIVERLRGLVGRDRLVTRSNSSIAPSSRSEASSTGAPPSSLARRPRGSADGRCRPAGGPRRPASRGCRTEESSGSVARARHPRSPIVPSPMSACRSRRAPRSKTASFAWTRASRGTRASVAQLLDEGRRPPGSSRATPAANRCAVSRTMPSRSSPTATRAPRPHGGAKRRRRSCRPSARRAP